MSTYRATATKTEVFIDDLVRKVLQTILADDEIEMTEVKNLRRFVDYLKLAMFGAQSCLVRFDDKRGGSRGLTVTDSRIHDADFYATAVSSGPVFSPWNGFGDFPSFHGCAVHHTLVSPDRCYVLYSLARQALALPGEFWECGVYRGGTAAMLAAIIARVSSRRLRLFDTFDGMPAVDPEKDIHRLGDFGDTSLEAVRAVVGHDAIVDYHPGYIPDTFAGLEASEIAMAHVDVDIHQSVMDCCRFIVPRLVRGGFIVFDDYGFPSCPGARSAVDEYFHWSCLYPLVLPTGQALVFKSL